MFDRYTATSAWRARPHFAVVGLTLALLVGAPSLVRAQSLNEAMAEAYSVNPTLNRARADLRSVNENVPGAKSGFRPSASLVGEVGLSRSRVQLPGPGVRNTVSRPATIALQITQPLFLGFRVVNGVKAAEAGVLAQRESLRNTEQTVFFNVVDAYMSVIRDGSFLSLRESEITFLREQVRAANDRLQVGEGTRTDVAQADARLQAAIAGLASGRASLQSSKASYRQVVGRDPKKLTSKNSMEKLLPSTLEKAIAQALRNHPAILASEHSVDASIFAVKVAEGALLPSVSLEGSVSRSWDQQGSDIADNAQIGLRASIPLYQGGGEHSDVRKAKEDLGAARIQVDIVRDQVRAGVVSAWSQYQAAVGSIEAARAQVEAQQLVLAGVIEEQRVGQRTTLDVLNAQSELISARANLIQAETNRVLAAAGVVSSVGKLTVEGLNLKVTRYDPAAHYNAVRNQWYGTTTPDGR